MWKKCSIRTWRMQIVHDLLYSHDYIHRGQCCFLLNRVRQPVQHSHTGIATPGEDKFSCATHTDKLIINQIWCHPNQAQITLLLSDDFVTCGKRNEVCKTLHGHRSTVVDVFLDSIM